MLRLIHTQTVQGSILIDDIDDGMPNKQIKRLGSTANPDAYKRDGYANEPKQPCYIPRTKPTDANVAGFIDLDETQRVSHSAFNGKISGHVQAGNITVVSLTASDLTAPVITGVTLDDPAAGDVTIDGTDFLSVAPDVTSVRLFGAGVGDVTLSQTQITAVSPGAVSDVEIIIDSTLIAGLQAAVAATGTLTSTGQVSDSDTVTIDGKVYTFQSSLTDSDGNVQIGGSQALSMENLRRAINLDGTGGSNYAASMTLHPTVSATDTATTVDITAKTPGAAGNLIATTDTSGTAGWATPTMTGGDDADEITITSDEQTSPAFPVS